MSAPSPTKHKTDIYRYYIDTRPFLSTILTTTRPNPRDLPALAIFDTLSQLDKDAVTRFYRPEHKYLALASTILKRWFIHRAASVPWDEITIQKTSHPHNRPYWSPSSSSSSTQKTPGLEFNISHQAGLVALLGCQTPHDQASRSFSRSVGDDTTNNHNTQIATTSQIELGLDITCTGEDQRTIKEVTTQQKFEEWVETFEEMFSDRELNLMKTTDFQSFLERNRENGRLPSKLTEMDLKMRLFYTYWALKEAYIKMVGEGLLADWLKRLEFVDVTPPDPIIYGGDDRKTMSITELESAEMSESEKCSWTAPDQAIRDTKILFCGEFVQSVDLELVAYKDNFIIATAMRGVEKEDDTHKNWISVDIDRDILPCAQGKCACLG